MQKETKWFTSQRAGGAIPAHLRNATKLTRFGDRDMENRKPFRNKKQRIEARRTAETCKDGTIRCFHVGFSSRTAKKVVDA